MALHTYVRSKLNEKYGDAVQAKTGPIRADLLGNMWAQEWGNIYPLVAPPGSGDLSYDIGELLEAKGKAPIDMVKAGENFYSSLGFAPLPETFWKRSLFVKPRDREVICHASAWDIDNKDDVRIKMCRSEEHTSELQSLMRISYAVFCLKKKNTKCSTTSTQDNQQLTKKV